MCHRLAKELSHPPFTDAETKTPKGKVTKPKVSQVEMSLPQLSAKAVRRVNGN